MWRESPRSLQVSSLLPASCGARRKPSVTASSRERSYWRLRTSPSRKRSCACLGARPDGTGRVLEKTTETKKNGSYSIKLPDREGLEYAVEAEYDGGLFVGDSTRVKPGSTKTMNIDVWKTSANPDAITITGDQLVVAQDNTSTQVLEVVTVENHSRSSHTLGAVDHLAPRDDEALRPSATRSLPKPSINRLS